MTYHWTWTGSGSPPPGVTIKVDASAIYTSPPGAVDDGLGQNDPPHPVLNGQGQVISSEQHGTKYVYAPVVSNGVTYVVSPSSSAHQGPAASR